MKAGSFFHEWKSLIDVIGANPGVEEIVILKGQKFNCDREGVSEASSTN